MSEASVPEKIKALKKHVSSLDKVKTLGVDIHNSPFLPSMLSEADAPADASFKCIFKSSDSKPLAFLLCSNERNPLLIQRNVEKARVAGNLLGHPLGNVIEMPFEEGTYEGLTWALFRILIPLSDSPWQWRLQKLRLAIPVTRWLSQVLAHTKKSVPENEMADTVLSPLEAMAEDNDFPNHARISARNALNRIKTGSWTPQTSLSHNDLWKGNVMLPRENTSQGFHLNFNIIDWAGSSTAGFAFFDLMKLARSLKFPGFFTRRLICEHCSILGCEPQDAMAYLLSALGTLGRNLDNFPRPVYLRMGTELIEDLKKIS